MVTAYDVPAEKLIALTAAKLREIDTIKPPEWAEFVRTGRHTEKAPSQKDWWYTRAASILRKVYILGPIGTSRLAEEYGGFADRGSKPNKAVKGSRNIARKCIMQLEAGGLVAKSKNKGRVITAKGQKMIDALAKEIAASEKK
ncbi:MAG TPA: 30S ribosomal protein S19e [Methanomassiliicoccales archaeon]|jgi:small subunit ribosomal protein S19e|nr:30S ribosomal protein S19e [Methanomassiliicoccales archaeon]